MKPSLSQFVQVRLSLLEFSLVWFFCMVWFGYSGAFRLSLVD